MMAVLMSVTGSGDTTIYKVLAMELGSFASRASVPMG